MSAPTNKQRDQAIRTERRLDFAIQDRYKCHEPVALYGGAGSRFYGPSYSQCNRSGIWEVTENNQVTSRYCAQHARKLGLITSDGPIPGVQRRTW